LRREVFEQRNLFVGERPYLLTVNRKDAEQGRILTECDNQAATGAAEID
jgi:hypothetical protein